MSEVTQTAYLEKTVVRLITPRIVTMSKKIHPKIRWGLDGHKRGDVSRSPYLTQNKQFDTLQCEEYL